MAKMKKLTAIQQECKDRQIVGFTSYSKEKLQAKLEDNKLLHNEDFGDSIHPCKLANSNKVTSYERSRSKIGKCFGITPACNTIPFRSCYKCNFDICEACIMHIKEASLDVKRNLESANMVPPNDIFSMPPTKKRQKKSIVEQENEAVQQQQSENANGALEEKEAALAKKCSEMAHQLDVYRREKHNFERDIKSLHDNLHHSMDGSSMVKSQPKKLKLK